MSVNAAIFAASARLHKDSGHGAALVIGFDGGSALIGHSRAAALVQELEGDSLPGSRQLRILSQDWQRRLLDQGQRTDFLHRHTSSPQSARSSGTQDMSTLAKLASDMPALDIPALQVVANLMNEGYVRAIVVTDTAGHLRDSLAKLDVRMQHFDCATLPPNVLKQLPVKTDPPLFINGGELLLDGCEPSSYGFEGEHLQAMEDALKNFLGKFAKVYCWGWCDINVPIERICPDGREFLYALGSYTMASIRMRRLVQIEHEGDDRNTVTTAILHAIGKTLFPETQAPKKPLGGAREPAHLAGSGVLGQNRYPLLPLDVLNHIRDQAHKPITIVCMDGAEVRHRSTAWLAESLSQQGRRCRVRTSANPVILGQYLFMFEESESDLCLIGHFDGEPVVPRMFPALLQELLPRELFEGEKPNRRRIILFGPAEMSSLFSGTPQADVIAVYANQWLVPQAVANWLVKTFEPHLSEVDAGKLASRMVDDSAQYMQFAADWLYDVTELWQADIEHESRDRARAGEPPLEFAEFERMWSTIRDRYQQRLAAIEEQFATLEPNFDFGQIRPQGESTPPPPERQWITQDFDIGPITPHGPDNESDDGSDDGPDGGLGDFDIGPITPR